MQALRRREWLLLILDLGSRWGWVVSVTPGRDLPLEKRPRCPLNRRPGGPEELVWTQINSLPLMEPENSLQRLQGPATGLCSLPVESSRHPHLVSLKPFLILSASTPMPLKRSVPSAFAIKMLYQFLLFKNVPSSCYYQYTASKYCIFFSTLFFSDDERRWFKPTWNNM
jgi:hypothetical protein